MASPSRFVVFAHALALAFLAACGPSTPATLAMPRPLSVSVDDCGWQSGPSLANVGGPWRLGARDPTLEDYQRLARIARRSGSRLVTLWVMSELDRANICARPMYNAPEAPSDMTEHGLAWDNGAHVNDGNFALMALMREEAAWLELGLHGVRHEHWNDGHRTRAEFGERGGRGWGERNTELHLRCFEELLRQYYTPAQSRFPVSFVPPNHGFEDARHTSAAASTGALLHAHGVRYAQKPGPTTFDRGLFWMSRDTSASPHFDTVAAVPASPPRDASWIMTHLPNFYGHEERWVSWLREVDAVVERWLPKNGGQAASQLLYARHARFALTPEGATLDTRDLPGEAYTLGLLGPLVLKVARTPDLASANAPLDIEASGGLRVVARYRDAFDHDVLYLADPRSPEGGITPGVYDLRLSHDQNQTRAHVELAASTLTVFAVERTTPTSLDVDLETYGAQTLELVVPEGEVSAVDSEAPGLHLGPWQWNHDAHRLTVPLTADDMQGERGRVHLTLSGATP